MSVQLILKNSSVQDKAATAHQLEIGEIALNYHESGPFLQCKDTAGQVWRIGGVIVADLAPGHPQPGTWWFKANTKELYFYNGTVWTEITGGGGGGGGGAVSSVFGRTGAVVAAEGDYTLDELADVDLTTNHPHKDDVLQYNGTKWTPVAPPDASTTVKGRIELATKAEVDAGTDTGRAVTPARLKDFVNAAIAIGTAAAVAPTGPVTGQMWIDTSKTPPVTNVWDGTKWVVVGAAAANASETVKGIAELATQAEVTAGTDDARIVTPLKLKQAQVWSRTGTTLSPKNAGDVVNITGIAQFGTGQATALAYFGDPATTGTRVIEVKRASAVTDIVNIQGVNAGVGATDIALQATGGNVGIGTATPGSALEINAAAATSPFIAKINTAEAARIDASGNVLIGGTLPATPNISLKANGSAKFAGGVTQPERTITAGAFNLATGNFWTCGAIAIPNPTNAVAGMSGLIRLTAAPSGWGGHFSTAPTPTVFPSIVPFYIESATSVRLGRAVGVN